MSNITIKNVIIGAVLLILAATVAILAVKLNDSVTTKTISSLSFKVGGLDEDGFEVKSDSTIVSKNFISADGLKIELKDGKVRYKIAFYDKNKKLVGEISEYYVSDYEAEELASNIVYAKIVIEPTADAEVSWTEVRKYASMLTITVNR